MDMKSIATVGNITKKEQLRSVDLEKCKTLVLETSAPFPGYHGMNLPEKAINGSQFLLTKSNYSDEIIVRAIQFVKSKSGLTFDATPSTITFQNKPVSAIRFKLLHYNDIPEVVKLFKKFDISFKEKKKVNPYDSIISIRKFFKVTRLEEGIYQDVENKNQYYIHIPKALDWDDFENITLNIKYNLEDSNFDAALVYVYYEKGIVDLVRIFCLDNKIEMLKQVRKKYLEKIK